MRISSVVCESSYVATSIVVQDGHALDKADTLLMILGDSAFNPLFTLFILLLGRFTERAEKMSVIYYSAFRASRFSSISVLLDG